MALKLEDIGETQRCKTRQAGLQKRATAARTKPNRATTVGGRG